MIFRKGDRVKLSSKGVCALFPRYAERLGTVTAMPLLWKDKVQIRWDDRKSHAYFHRDFIEKVEATAPEGGDAA